MDIEARDAAKSFTVTAVRNFRMSDTKAMIW